jgi:hypothetical protein
VKIWTLIAAMVCVVNSAVAAEYSASGTIQKIFALDKVQYGADKSHILISGFASAGTCPTNDGSIALALRDDDGGRRQLAVALSAKLANLQVAIRVEDAFKNSSGHCYLKYLELN